MDAEEKIRVVIVDDIAETRENIRKLLQFESDVEVVGVARTGKEGIDLSNELMPDVVLMDINMPDMDGIQATEEIRDTTSITQIVILSVQSDPNYMRRAMLAGARDFLAKPPVVDELTAAIRRAGKMAHEERAKSDRVVLPQPSMPGPVSVSTAGVAYGRVITVYSPKGGTGCTTIATNLAISLNNQDTGVVLVDGNLQYGDVAVFLNEQGKYSIVDLAQRADELDPDIVSDITITHSKSGMGILAAPFRPEYSEGVSGEQFSKTIRYLRRMFSYVIMDTASGLDDITISALDSSDIIILITTQDIPSIKNSRLFLDLLDALGIDRKRVLLVMNRYDKRIGITPDRISENFKQDVSAVVPLEERIVIPSVNRGHPFMLGDKSKPVARAVLSLTESVRERIAELETIEQQEF
jgi:pilus assembly protein CpaE